jgi:hypothetical protein
MVMSMTKLPEQNSEMKKILSDNIGISALTADDPDTYMVLKTIRWLKIQAYNYADAVNWTPDKFDNISEMTEDEWHIYNRIWRQTMANTPWIRNISGSNNTLYMELKNVDFLSLIHSIADRENNISSHVIELYNFLLYSKDKLQAKEVIDNFFLNAMGKEQTANAVLMPIVRNNGVLNGSIISLGINSPDRSWISRLKNDYFGTTADVQVKFEFIVYDYYDDIWRSKGLPATNRIDIDEVKCFEFI